MSFLTSPGSGTITYQSFLLKTNAGTIFSSRFIKNVRTASVPHMWQSCFSLVSPQCSDLKYRAMLGIWESHLQKKREVCNGCRLSEKLGVFCTGRRLFNVLSVTVGSGRSVLELDTL